MHADTFHYQLLQAIGAILALEAKKATSQSGNYQESATAPLNVGDDDEVAGLNDADEQDPLCLSKDTNGHILIGVDKVTTILLYASWKTLLIDIQLRKIIHAIRSSPQRKESWLAIVGDSIKKDIAALKAKKVLAALQPEKTDNDEDDPIICKVLSLILDVRMRWSSTHQMLGMFHCLIQLLF